MPDQPTVTTGTNAVTVRAIFEPPHNFVEMHHYGNPDGLHYCPTGFAICDGAHDPECVEVRELDGACRLWGEEGPDDSDLDMTEAEFDQQWAEGTPVQVTESHPEPTEGELLTWYTCKRKQRHPDRKAAVYAARRLGGLVRPYACQRCEGWHVGRPFPLRDVALNSRQRRRRLVDRARAAWRKAGRPQWS